MDPIKNKKILKFIRLAVLRPEQIDAILPHLTQSLADPLKKVDYSKIQEQSKQRILSDEHLSQFIPSIDAIFSLQEIQRLIEFYQDPAVAKYFANGALVGPAIYASFTPVIQSLIEGEPE